MKETLKKVAWVDVGIVVGAVGIILILLSPKALNLGAELPQDVAIEVVHVHTKPAVEPIAVPTIKPEVVAKSAPLTTWDIDTMNLIKILAFEEGFRTDPYLCSEGFVTIGLGTKLHKSKGMDPADFPIKVTRRIAEEWLHTEVAVKDSKLLRSNSGHTYANLSDDQRAIILSMAYQMGVRGVLNFRRMWHALAEGNDDQAALEALDSSWAQQTPERAERHARVLRGESLEEVYGEIHG